MKILVVIIFILIFLSGCGTIKNSFCDYEIVPKAEPMKIDTSLFEPCPDLIVPKTPLTTETILESKKDDVSVYVACKNKQKATAIALKKLSNN